jgi:Cof subfamily protein (haloacid dehalogenase superfamily)
MEKLPSSRLDIKIIALDLDDTLLNKELKITPKTVAALQKAAFAGIYVVPCSGRTENAILPFVHVLNIAGMETGRYIIASNGTSVFDLHKRTQILSQKVSAEVLLHVENAASEMGLPCQVYDPSTIYANVDNKYTRLDADLCNLKLEIVDDFKTFLQKGHPKMVVPGDPETLLVLQDKLKAELNGKAVIFISKPYFLEIMPYNCGKGEALVWLCNHLGIDSEKSMAFGDSMNDESMIRMAKHSVAMINGLPYIKDIAPYVTRLSNEEDGIGDFIENFIRL